jgi:hypothetical protein
MKLFMTHSAHLFSTVGALAGVLCAATVAFAEEPAPTYQWLPAEAADAGSGLGDAATPLVLLPVTITKTPKATADVSRFAKLYTIDLQKFNIKNDGTDAAATSRGLNAALQDAKAQGANRIVFPKGTYLISETEPIIFDHKNTIIDLNGATLQMNTNGLPDYTMVSIENGAENMRLTNGTLRGDRDTHDYKTIKSTHEHCRLLRFNSGRNLEVDHLTVANAPGFAITTSVQGSRNRPELLSMIYHSVMIRDLEQGAFSDTGEKIEDTSKTRSGKPYDVSRIPGEFEFGYMAGYQGFPYILDRNYQVVFYDADMKFLEKRRVLQYRKVAVPAGAKFMNLEFNQSKVSTEPAHSGAGKDGWCGRITNFKSPTDVHFHDNVITYNRGLGMAFTGGQKWIIENNVWEKNGPQAPGYAIDFEDGWEMMQDVVLRKNTFRDNFGDLVVCAGSELLFEDNTFQKHVIFYGRVYNSTIRRNQFIGSRISYSTRNGVMNIHDNEYRDNPAIAITFDGKGVADGFMREPGAAVKTPALTLANEKMTNVQQVTGTYFKIVRSQLENVHFVAGKSTVLADFQGSDLQNSSLTYEKDGPDVLVNFKGAKGVLREEGPGLERRKPLAPAS